MLIVVMTMMTLTTLTTHAISLDYSGGSSSNNTGASPTTSGFSVSYDDANKNICGYRFSVVTSSGTPKSGTKVVNVYLSDIDDGNTAYSSAQRFIISSGKVANKKQLANDTKVSSTSSKQSCDYKSGDCGFYSTLPQSPSSVGSWIKKSTNSYQNLSRIYVLCGTDLSKATESDYVLIEPIFWPRLAGTKTAATATELALYGAAISGGDGYNGANGALTDAGAESIKNICNYINREFPNSLYVDSDTDVYSAVTIKTSGRYTYKQIIQKGFGCSVLTVKNVITVNKVKIAYHPNGGTVSTAIINSSGFMVLEDSAWIHSISYGKKADPYNASTFGLTRKGYSFGGWEVKSTGKQLDQSTEYDSTVYAQYDDKTKTTENAKTVYCHLYAIWLPNTVKLAYHPNGGTTSIATINSSGFMVLEDSAWIHSVSFGKEADPYNASTFGLTRTGYEFKGWEVKSTGKELDQNTEYDSTLYAQHDDETKTTENTKTVYCHLYAVWEEDSKIVIVPIEPNASYRENTDVISSFWLVNISGKDYTPATGATVEFSVFDSSGEKIAEESQSFVAPKDDKNLAYFKWHVPNGLRGTDVTVKAHIVEGASKYSHTERIYRVASFDTCKTPDTSYDAKAPEDFEIPDMPSNNTLSARWWKWEYEGGSFIKKEYGTTNSVNNVTLTTPTNPTAYISGGTLHMKSGYGFECSYTHSMATISGYQSTSASQSVAPQYLYALFPEYNYTYGANQCRSFEAVSGRKVFINATGMNRQHFTPIYFPDGQYKFQIVLSDCWTPAGMLTTYKTVTIQIDGNMYDDWYVGRK